MEEEEYSTLNLPKPQAKPKQSHKSHQVMISNRCYFTFISSHFTRKRRIITTIAQLEVQYKLKLKPRKRRYHTFSTQ